MNLSKPIARTALAKQQARRRPLGYRLPVTRTNASNSPALALPKGDHAAEQRVEAYAESAHRAQVRRDVWARSSVCEYCGETERQTAAHSPKATHELHENGDKTRAKTRGMAPAERFDSSWSARLCQPCHLLITANRYRLRPLTMAGLDGSFVVERSGSARPKAGDWIEVRTVLR